MVISRDIPVPMSKVNGGWFPLAVVADSAAGAWEMILAKSAS